MPQRVQPEFRQQEPLAVGESIAAVPRQGVDVLSNVARHANAATVTIEIRSSAAECVLTVRYNGCGIGAVTRRSGLATMRARAETHGGTFTCRPAALGAGTELIWSIPSARSE
ncbi:sensor histidine kinase [Nocardia sp. IFM 10818]